MIKLYSEKEFEKTKSNDKLPLQCRLCKTTFYVAKKYIKNAIRNALESENKINHYQYCGRNCSAKASITRITEPCANCNMNVIRTLNQKRISKSGNIFCSKSCAAAYNNTHKTTGNRRSKLEAWLEVQLTNLYPNLKILFNDKTTINSELDIYIPSLNVAFELNGIFHYEPIYGKDKLSSIQNNDDRKFQACLENDIELVIIDTSGQKYFKNTTSQKYLEIIKFIIDNKQ